MSQCGITESDSALTNIAQSQTPRLLTQRKVKKNVVLIECCASEYLGETGAHV